MGPALRASQPSANWCEFTQVSTACEFDPVREFLALDAAIGAEAIKRGELAARIVGAAHLQIEFAQILVGAQMAGIEREGFVIVGKRCFVAAELAAGESEIIEDVGMWSDRGAGPIERDQRFGVMPRIHKADGLGISRTPLLCAGNEPAHTG